MLRETGIPRLLPDPNLCGGAPARIEIARSWTCASTSIASRILAPLNLLTLSEPGIGRKVTKVHEDAELSRALYEAGLAYIARRHSAAVVTEALLRAVVETKAA